MQEFELRYSGPTIHDQVKQRRFVVIKVETATCCDCVWIMLLRGVLNAHSESAYPIMNLPRIRATVTKNQAAAQRRFRIA